MFTILFTQDKSDDVCFRALLRFENITVTMDGDYIDTLEFDKLTDDIVNFEHDDCGISISLKYGTVTAYTGNFKMQCVVEHTQENIDSLFTCLNKWLERYSSFYKN